MRGISENKCSTMPCALCCNLIYSFSSYYNHTFALVFHVLHLQIKKLFYMFAPVPQQAEDSACLLVATILFSHQSVANTKSCRVYDAQHLQYASCVQVATTTAGFTIFPTFVALVTKKTYVECTKSYVGTLPPRPPPANHKPQTREPWPQLADFADFDTTISNSFLGQISYLRRGNPLRASAPATQ